MAIDDRRLTLLQNPASLQSTSAVMVAAELWRIEISKNGFDAHTLKNANPRLHPNLSLPKSIEAIINSCIKPMKKSMISWQDFHYLRVFYPHDRTNCIALYSDFLVWRFDCEISYKDTAKNLIEFPQLSTISKYKLACLYCFEDDIRKLWDLLPSNDNLRNTSFETDPLLYYWACRMKNEPLSIEIRSGRTIDGEMIERTGTWSSFLYFWNRLQPTEQIDLFVLFVKNTMEEETRFLLGFLSETQLETAVERSSVNIIVSLACLPENVEFTLQTWHYIKNTVTVQDFVDMICDIAFLDSSLGHVSSLLYDIWHETPDNLKSQVLADHLDVVLEDLYSASCEAVFGLSRDVRLITELLRHYDLQSRNKYWMTYWTWLISGVNSTRLSILMKLCFESEEKIAEFKSTYMTDYSNIKTYCDLLLGRSCFDELNEFLNFCSSDPLVVSNLKKTIAWSKTSIKYFVHYYGDDEKAKAFEEFVKDIQVEADQGKDLKCQLISSFWNDGYLRERMNGGNMQSIKNLVCMVSDDGIDTSEIKRNLLETCQCILTKGKFKTFDGQEWNEFLLWCMNQDTDRLSEFKRTLPIDDIFRKLFDEWIASVRYSFLSYPFGHSSFTMNPNRRYPYDIYDTESNTDDGSVFETDDDRTSQANDDVSDQTYDSDSDQSAFEDIASLFASNSRPLSVNSVSEWMSDSDQSEDDQGSMSENDDYDDPNESGDSASDASGSFSESNFTDNVIESFDTMDNFLMWYFSDPDKINEFKIMKIQHHDENFSFHETLNSGDEYLSKIVLEWFFNGDDEQIAIFKASLNN